jgi:23S rRNA (adenine2503-C2)-methyltransferase
MERDWYSLLPEELEAEIKAMGEKSFRSRQIFQWLHQKGAVSFDEMTDLGAALRRKLEDIQPLHPLELVTKQVSKEEGRTGKYLFRLADGREIETVLMEYHYGFSLCISSQVGCRMGCRFCASTLRGLERNLTAGEMLQQIYTVEREEGVRISHVVVMGCGEPFDNYTEILRFLQLINREEGKHISLRNITISTCGLTKRIRNFADEQLGVTLAISLHAPDDVTRRKIMKIAQAVSIDELMEACRYYIEKTHRRVTFEYALIRDVNDSREHALRLAALLKGMLCHVNLIPINPVTECGMERPRPETVQKFYDVLEERHIPVTLRREMGSDIDAACGQLRARHQ